MKEKILALLKAKAAGVANEVLTGVAVWLATTVTKEEDIDTAVSGVLPLLTTMQSENDRRVTAFQQENTTLKEENTKLKGKAPKKTDDPPTDDVPAWAQAIIDQNKILLSQVETLKTENMGKLHQQTLIAKLKELEVPEKFFTPAIKGRTFKDETEITAFAEEIKTNFSDYAQDLADQGLGNVTKPVLSTKTDKDGLTEGVKNYLDNKFPDPSKPEVAGLGGKKL